MHMRRIITSIFLALALLLLPLTDQAQQSSPDKPQVPTPAPSSAPKQEPAQKSNETIISVVNLVDVLFTVLNRRNKLVPELEKGDFKIWDDKAPQEIRYFSKQTDLPLRIGMLLDTSNSIRDRIKFEQDASINFLFSVLRRNKDEAFAMTFDDEPQIIQSFTGDAGALRDQITKTRAGGGTAIYDAIYEACVKELSHPPRPPGDQPDVVRRVMILIATARTIYPTTRARMPSKWRSAPAWSSTRLAPARSGFRFRRPIRTRPATASITSRTATKSSRSLPRKPAAA